MTHIKIILHENTPCWYELSYQELPPSLILRIHKEFIASKKVIFNVAPIVKHFKEEFKLPDFQEDFSKNIGFGGVFKYKGEKDNFIEYQISIPIVKKFTGKKCKECGGTGYRKEVDMNCLYCDHGKEWTMDWSEVTKISATFTVLTGWLMYPEIDTTCPYPQLMTLQTATQHDIHGGSLSGDCSIPFRTYLESLGEIRLPDVAEATKSAYKKMLGWKEYYEHDFSAWLSKGRFIINCPGDACGLHPSDWHSFKDEGFEFSCHNVDSAIQQLTLIVGLAKLCDMAREKL